MTSIYINLEDEIKQNLKCFGASQSSQQPKPPAVYIDSRRTLIIIRSSALNLLIGIPKNALM